MTFKVYRSETFNKILTKFPKDFKEWVDKIESQLINNPYIGDPIKVPWFREKKKDKYRIYYLIYEELKKVYLVNISEKKDQQKVINAIWFLLENYKEEIETKVT